VAVGTVAGKLLTVDSARGFAMANTCYRGYLEFNQAPDSRRNDYERSPRSDVTPRDSRDASGTRSLKSAPDAADPNSLACTSKSIY